MKMTLQQQFPVSFIVGKIATKAWFRVCGPKTQVSELSWHVHLREDKSIAIDPVGVLGVESHELVEENVGDGCHAHGCAGMPGVGFEGGIDLHIELSTSNALLLFAQSL